MMKIGLWEYLSDNGYRKAVVLANDKTIAYDNCPLAIFPKQFNLVQWLGECPEEESRLVLDAPCPMP